MSYLYDDGGRAAAGYKGESDCGTRAVAVAHNMHYTLAARLLRRHAKMGKAGNGTISRGIYKEDMDSALRELGWKWYPAPKFDGRKARYYDIKGTAILRMSRHYVAVIDGVLHDTFDSSDKMVYGYWAKA